MYSQCSSEEARELATETTHNLAKNKSIIISKQQNNNNKKKKGRKENEMHTISDVNNDFILLRERKETFCGFFLLL